MADPAPTGRAKWLWIILILALLAVLVIWLLDPAGDSEEVVPAPAPTDLIVEPTGPAVPVELPTARLTPVPETPAPAGTAAP